MAQEAFDPLLSEKIFQQEQFVARQKMSYRESALTSNYDQVYLRTSWNIDPTIYYISGEVTFYIRAANEDLTTVYFDLSDSLQCNWFLFRGDTIYDFARPGGDLLELHLGNPISSGQIDSVTINYEGIPVASGFGSFSQSGHNGDSIISTLSEPYGSSDWFPCKKSLSDKLDSLDVFVKTPVKYKVGTNGILVSEIPVGSEEKIVHWRHRYPIATYLIGVAVTNYAVLEEEALLSSGDTVKVLNYLYPEDSATYAQSSHAVLGFLQLYSDLFGDYPFINEKYGVAQWNWGGGMEHQTMSFVLAAEIFELAAHELGHQWFGDKVTCGSWQDIWLNEGFATYLSGLCYENIATQYWMSFKITQRDRALRDSTGSVFCEDTTDVARIFSGSLSYSKGAYLLHMLRWKLGDEVFFQAIRNYVNDADLCYSFARTEDLKQHLEETSGQNLDEFFDDWFYGKGYPGYHIKWLKLSDGTVKFSVHQTQNNPDVSFFEMPVPIFLKNATADTTLVLNVTENDMTFQAGPFDFAPDSLFIDPELWLLTKHNSVEYDSLLSSSLLVFPNPAIDEIKISYTNSSDRLREVVLYDVAGKKLVSLSVSEISFFNPVIINISNLARGCYFLDLVTDDHSYVERIVKL
jgi:aminopeptidase N